MTNARENSRYGHVFRPGPFRRVRAYWVDVALLHWRVGAEYGHCRILDIAALEESPDGRTLRITQADGREHRLSDVYWYRWIPTERRRWRRRERRPHTLQNLLVALQRRQTRQHPQ